MRIIGITGGIGSGKSTVLGFLKKESGCFVIEADKLAHKLMEPGCMLYESVIGEFGGSILKPDKTIDRQVFGKLVFGDEALLKKLNELVHPAVKEYILSDIENKKNEKYSFYVIEAALLIEDGYKAICDEIWYIYVDEKERIKRLMVSRDGTVEKWKKIISNQSPDSFYINNSDYVIDNSKNMEETEYIVKELLSKPR